MQLPHITQLLQKRMDRKDFLRAVGLMALTVIGLGILVKQTPSSSSSQPSTARAPQPTDKTYGA